MMTRRRLAMVVVVLCSVVFAQRATAAEDRVIVYLVEGVVTLPPGAGPHGLASVEISDAALLQTLSQHGVSQNEPCFPGFTQSDRTRVSRTGNTVVLRDYSRVYVLTLDQSIQVAGLLGALKSEPSVTAVEPVVPDQAEQACPGPFPNDPFYLSGLQWHARNCIEGEDMRLGGAWGVTTGDASVMIGIVDYGVLATHPDLIGKVTGDGGVSVAWPSHGTQMAGLAAAYGDNAEGVAGVSWGAQINSQRVDIGTTAEAILGAVTAGADVINMSIGNNTMSPLTHDVLATAYKLDVVLVASAGNDNNSVPHYPSNYYETMSVAATDRHGLRYTDGNFGPFVDVAGPAVGTYTTTHDPGDPDNLYDPTGGTSAAAALVSGLAALLLSVDPSLPVEDVAGVIKSSSDDINAATYPGRDDFIGEGRINATEAIARLSAPYSLAHLSAAGVTTATVMNDRHGHVFVDTPGLTEGLMYLVDRVRVTRSVSFGAEYVIPPDVWGRKGTTGTYPEMNVTYNVGWCEPVPGSITTTGCVLRSYLFDVYHPSSGAYLGTYPTSIDDAVFEFSVLGIVDVAPPTLGVLSPNGGETYTTRDQVDILWQVEDEYLPGTLSSIFLVEDLGGGNRNIWVIAEDQAVDENGYGSYTWEVWQGTQTVDTHLIRIVTTDVSGFTADESDGFFTVVYRTKGGGPAPPPPCEEPCPSQGVPSFFTDMVGNHPNPFNPMTNVQFTLAGDGPTTLSIYDVSGRRVRVLRDEYMIAGKHTTAWDGRSTSAQRLPSGVYFAVLSTRRGQYSHKLLMLR